MADIFIAIGSNIEPERNIADAIAELRSIAAPIRISTVYRTKPLLRPDQPDFLNGVVQVQTALEREAVDRDLLKPIEAALDRVRSADKHAARTIDLDLAVYCVDGQAVWADEDVYRRNFVAVPLAELAAGLRLPNGRTTAEVADVLGSKGLVADEAMTKRFRELAE